MKMQKLSEETDVETLKQWFRDGIPLSTSQMQAIRDTGGIPLTNEQRHEKARNAAIEAAKRLPSDMLCYTECFQYFYAQALSQINSQQAVYLTMPDPLPLDWVLMSDARKQHLATGGRKNRPISPPTIENQALEEEIARQNATKYAP